MLQCHHIHTLSPPHLFPLSHHHHHHHYPHNFSQFLFPQHKPITLPRTKPRQWRAQLSEPTTGTTTETESSPPPPPPPPPPEDGPVELLNSSPTIFATSDDPSPLQVTTSVLLTGAITVFLFRAIRRRAKRVKETKFRSSGAKSLKEEALDSLKTIGAAPIDPKKPPSPVQAFLGAISAGVIALILYKFTTTIEASLNRQTISDNYSVRQITVTIRTIINGLCYLATFVFGANAIGLFLYSGQLAINSLMEGPSSEENESEGSGQSASLTNSTPESLSNGVESNHSQEDQSSDEK